MAYTEVTLESKVLKQYADCVEWCPITEFQDIFVCATYQLMDDKVSDPLPKKRMGSLCLFQVTQQGSLEEVHHLETCGVLDVKWCPVANSEGEPLLGIADSEGRVSLFILRGNAEGGKPSLFEVDSLSCVDAEETLCLYLDWTVADKELNIAVSDSKGNISILDVMNNHLQLLRRWNAHEHEAWVTTFDNEDKNVVYSGGDDNKLVIYDIRQEQRVTCRSHDAGVTSLKCSKNPNMLASGSYDEVLRLWDKRNWKYPSEEIKLGGGVWRIKLDPHSECILAACMHAGFKLINFSTSATGSSMSTEFTYSKHDSLAYGCDWCFSDMLHNTIGKNLKLKDTKGLIATCSFYDSKLSLWLLCSQNIKKPVPMS